MENYNVVKDRAENRQAKRDEAANQQHQSAEQLHGADGVVVMAGDEHLDIITGQTRRWWRLGNKVQKKVQTENDEGQSEENPDNDSENFHDGL